MVRWLRLARQALAIDFLVCGQAKHGRTVLALPGSMVTRPRGRRRFTPFRSIFDVSPNAARICLERCPMAEIMHPFYESHRGAMEAAMRHRLDLAEAMLCERAHLSNIDVIRQEVSRTEAS